MNQDQDQDHPHHQTHNHGHDEPAQRHPASKAGTKAQLSNSQPQLDAKRLNFTAIYSFFNMTERFGASPHCNCAPGVPLLQPNQWGTSSGGVVTSHLTGSSGCPSPFPAHGNRAHMVTGYRTWFFWRQTLESNSRLRGWCFGCWGLSLGGGEWCKLGEVFLYCYMAKVFKQQQGTEVIRNSKQWQRHCRRDDGQSYWRELCQRGPR